MRAAYWGEAFAMKNDLSSVSTSPFQNMQDYERLYKEASADRLGFWKKQADSELQWMQPYSEVLRWKNPFAEWFVGKINASAQCLDRHQGTSTWEKTALIYESEAGAVRKYTYREMTEEVARLAGGLLKLGVHAGDLVTIYMPLVPESMFAMLACARVGAVHSVVFGGFSAEALKDRILDAKSKLVITADGGFRRGQVLPLKANVDLAVAHCPSVQSVLVLKCAGNSVPMTAGRDHWWSDVVSGAAAAPAVPRDSEDLLFTLYTSGTTGKPKGIMHTHAGYLLWTKLSTKWVFDLRENDIYWCTADVGWITGHSYLVYGPLQAGATIFCTKGPHNTRIGDASGR